MASIYDVANNTNTSEEKKDEWTRLEVKFLIK